MGVRVKWLNQEMMRCRKAEKTERVDEDADDNETKRYNTNGSTGELYTQHLPQSIYADRASASGPPQQYRIYSHPIS
jgi:hypothetical protein